MRASYAVVALSLALCSAPAVAQSRYDRAAAPTASQFADQFDARIAKLKADLRLTPDQARNWDSLRNALHDIGAARANRLAKFYGDREANADRNRDTAADRGAPVPQSAPSADNRPVPDRDAAVNDATTRADADRRAEADRAANDDMAHERTATRDRDPRGARARDDGAIADMRMQAQAMQERADDLKKIADAADPLYATLDARQRRLLLRFIARDWQNRPSVRG